MSGERKSAAAASSKERLRRRVEELETTLQAIARGEIDALVIARPNGPQVFALQGADQPYRVLVENMNEGALALLPDGTISYGNRRLAQSIKRPLEEVIGANFQDFLSSPDKAAFERLMVSGGVARELTLIAGDRSRVPVQISVQPMETAGGPLLAVVVTDLSDVWRNRELLATVANNVPNLLLAAWDSTGVYTMSAGRELQVLGRSPDYLIGTSLLRTNAFPADRIIQGRRRVLAGEQVSDTIHLKGRTLDVWMTPIKDAAGAVIGGVMGAADVTERVRIERELEQRVAQQSAVAAFGQLALEGLDPQALAREATRLVRRILSVDRCSILELQADGRHLRVNLGALDSSGPPAILPLAEFPQAQQVLANLRPSVENDFAASPYSDSTEANRYGIRSGMVVPIPGRQRPYGTLGAYSTNPRSFSSDDLNFISAIATLFAQALHRYEAEAESRQREEFYRTLTENLSEAIAVITPEGTLDYISTSTERVLGYRPVDVVGTSAFWYIAPDQAQWLRASLSRALANPGQPTTAEVRLRRKDGTWGDYETVHQAVKQPDGRAVIVSTQRDISERKQAERERQLLASIVESAEQAITSRDLELRVTSWNPGAERLFGLKAAEMIGTKPGFLDFTDLNEPYEQAVRRALKERIALSLESQFVHPDGRLVDIAVTVAPLFDSHGEAVGVMSISHNVTERRLAERARELARSNAELDQFAAVVSHDLKAPLRTLGAFAQLLQRRLAGHDDGEVQQYLKYIDHGARQMSELIDALLDYARLKSGAETLTAVDCQALMGEIVHTLAPAIEAAQAQVRFDGLPTVMGDRILLFQLFQNLIANALKFRGEVPPLIRVQAEKLDRQWRFAVRDNGIGIRRHDAERIFNMFERLHSRQEYQGTGIGLAICKKVVERLGGRIWVESELGQGATFYFTLPLT